nr:DUF3631 domain-containing protein [Actinomycetota bacterium]
MNETAILLNRVEEFIARYVALGRLELTASSLWTLHTHVMDAAFSTPYLAITSAVPESGKTRLLEVLKRLVASPWMTSSTSAAALVRYVDTKSPTLLYDESDNSFKRDKEFIAAFQSVLNSGYRRGGAATISVKAGGDWDVRNFSTYCPKALAGLGNLPDTVASRSIPIVLKRRGPGETVEKFRERQADELAEPIYIDLCSWGSLHVDQLAESVPALPPNLSDRAEDVWEPLVAIAELAGDRWVKLAWEATALSRTSASNDDSLGIKLLEDITPIIDGLVEVPSAALVAALNDLPESPWAEFTRGRPLTQRKLADLLRPFGVCPHSNGTRRVYLASSFEDPFRRYLVQSVKVSEPQQPCGVEAISEVSAEPSPDTSKNSGIPHQHSDPDTLTLRTPENGGRASLSASEKAVARDRVARAELEKRDAERAEADARIRAELEQEQGALDEAKGIRLQR